MLYFNMKIQHVTMLTKADTLFYKISPFCVWEDGFCSCTEAHNKAVIEHSCDVLN